MADTNTTVLGLLLMETGGDTNTWGQNLNAQVIQYLEDKITGRTSTTTTGGATTLSQANCRAAFLIFNGALGSDATITVPNTKNSWIVINNLSGSFALKFKTSGGSASAAIAQGGHCLVFCDGADVITVGLSSSVLGTQLQGGDGTVSLPYYSFSADTNSGFYRIGADNIGLALNGAKVADFSTTGTAITGTFSSSGAMTVTSGGITVTAGAITITAGGMTVTAGQISNNNGTVAAPAYSFTSDLDCGSYRIGANNIGYAVNGAKVLDISTTGLGVTGTLVGSSTITGTGFIVGSNPTATPGKAPTAQFLTSGASATYTTPAGCTYIEVYAAGGGGATGTGGATTFNSVVANGGSAGSGPTGATGGAGGAGGASGSGSATQRYRGNAGGTASSATAGSPSTTGNGGCGGGHPIFGGGAIQNTSAAANTGAGAGGASSGGGVGGSGGGGSGEGFFLLIGSPSATYIYTIGAGGTGGGGSGYILVKEFYN